MENDDKGYLVITLRKGDFIHVGDDIKISLGHKCKCSRASIGITAPKSMRIVRDLAKDREDENINGNK